MKESCKMNKEARITETKEIRFKSQTAKDKISSPCSCSSASATQACSLEQNEASCVWVVGTVKTSAGAVIKVRP